MRIPVLILTALSAVCGLSGGSALAQEEFLDPLGGAAKKEIPATAEVVAEVSEIAPGEPFRIALKITHAPHWHTYYLNPGQVGFPPAVEWELPEGFQAEDLRFPVPMVGTFSGLPFYGYEGETWFLQTITPPATLKAGETVTLSGEASWLACKESCIPGDAELKLTLPVAASAAPNPAAAEGFAKADAAMPLETKAWTVEATGVGDTVTLHLTPAEGATGELADVHFFSSDSLEDASKPQELKKDGESWTLTFPRHPETDPKPTGVSGILKAGSGWIAGNPSKGIALKEIPITAPAATAAAAPGPEATSGSGQTPQEKKGLLAILALMFVGGLILNLMPCVFPVIGLKIMGFVQQAGHDRKKIVAHGLVFSLGVLISLWTLCAIMLAGGITSWGGQLQNPWVTLALVLVMLIFGLNMFGIFEIGTSATGVGGGLMNRNGLTGSFFTGVLATVVATPCSAPFLVTGLTATAALPGPLFFLSFTFMGLGLSLPYLLLSIFPSLVDKLPRPGPWMESFKQGMSFLLFGAAAWLVTSYLKLVGHQLGEQKPVWVLIGLTIIAAGFWVYGRWSVPYRSAKSRGIGRVAAAAIILSGVMLAKPSPESNVPVIHWEAWSAARQQELLEEGKSVYVDFTASWCFTCQTNKAAAYTEETARLFQTHGIVALKADKTRNSPEIDAELVRLGNAAKSIPMNVLYAKGNPTPHITQTILTAGYLQGFVRQRLGEGPVQP